MGRVMKPPSSVQSEEQKNRSFVQQSDMEQKQRSNNAPFFLEDDFLPLESSDYKPHELERSNIHMKRKKPPKSLGSSSDSSSAASGSSDDEDTEEAVAPWKTTSYPENAFGLHLEILDFVEFISPLPEERNMRRDVVSRLTAVINDLWPRARVDVFGSYRTKLYLPTSDIDLVVFGRWKHLPLFTLERALIKAGIVTSSDIKVLDKATVPIIKLKDIQSKVCIDISFNVESAVTAAELIKEYTTAMPVIRYLFCIVKQFLVQRDLNEVFTGGVSSYCLLLLIISFLQRHARADVRSEGRDVNLGVLLVEFFELYGRNFNYEQIAIRIRDGGRYICKYTLMDEQGTGNTPALLSVEDPVTAGNDVGRSSYGMIRVKETFEYAFNVLSAALRNRQHFKNTPDSTYLSRIIEVPDAVLEYRVWVQKMYAVPTFIIDTGITTQTSPTGYPQDSAITTLIFNNSSTPIELVSGVLTTEDSRPVPPAANPPPPHTAAPDTADRAPPACRKLRQSKSSQNSSQSSHTETAANKTFPLSSIISSRAGENKVKSLNRSSSTGSLASVSATDSAATDSTTGSAAKSSGAGMNRQPKKSQRTAGNKSAKSAKAKHECSHGSGDSAAASVTV